MMCADATNHVNHWAKLRYDPRVTDTDRLDIVPLTPARFADLAALFEEGGDPKWCWCTYHRVRGRSWANATPEGNRSELKRLAARKPSQHPAPGLVAYRDGRAIGWVSLGPRDDYDRFASSLLDAAIAYAREAGSSMLEAYPVDTGEGRVSAASAFHGTLSMFERAGFRVVARRQWNKSSPVRPIVRLEVKALTP
jgi:hypothetical protein